jgi:RimJ/RimL family protein N-acetyltransferase
MTKNTERLELVPLTLSQLKLWLYDISAFEKELNCSYRGEPLTGFMQEYVKAQIETITKDEGNYLFHTFWLIILKSDRIAVGSAAYKGVPNEHGEIEIGYGLGKEFEHNGYMTEAVREICNWGMEQEQVKNIIAETDMDGYASQRILQRVGFVREEKENGCWWRL